MAFGITSAGFIPKTIADVRSSLRTAWRNVFGVAVNVDPRSRNGQEIDIFSAAIAEVWALGESIYHALDPGGAGGQLLDNLVGISGLTRKAPTKTQLVDGLVLTGLAATVIAAGKVASTEGLGQRFVTLEVGTLALAGDWSALADGTVVAAGAFYWRNDGSADRVYRVMVGGNIGTPKENPSGTASAITCGAATLAYMGDGKSYDVVSAQAEETGPIPAFAFSVTAIETPVTNWQGVNNPNDHTRLGTNLETDPALRIRREQSVAKPGRSPIDDMRAELLDLDGVTSCTIFENASDATVDNLPPKSIEVLIEGGADQAITDTIGSTKTAGGETIGTTSGTYVDTHGDSHTLKHSRPELVSIWVTVPLVKDPNVYPTDGDAQVKDLIVELGDALGLGRDVVASQLESFVWQIPGVLDVGPILIRTSSPPIASTTIVLSARQRASFDTSRTTVNATNGTP